MFKIIIQDELLILTDGFEKFGPYKDYEEMALDVARMEDEEKRCLEIFHQPKDLVFDIGSEDEQSLDYYIILGSKINPGNDDLGSHNVSGLPLGLLHEDMECTWSIKGYKKSDIIDAMIKNGFTYDKFL